jgi:isoleucyl-tRNA synthetase
MDFAAEAQIARELMKFAQNGTLYLGSKPVMWSVVEQTALAEAEVEYEDYVSDQIWVKFPLRRSAASHSDAAGKLSGASVVVWTTTPWTIPGNRAISFSPKIEYGLYEVVDAPAGNWSIPGDLFLLADKLAAETFRQARVTAFRRLDAVAADEIARLSCQHPLKPVGGNYEFVVPLLAGDHVTDDVGTGFVHTAPGHGRDDFDVWTANAANLLARGIDTAIPYTVDAEGRFTEQAPGFAGKSVITKKGEKGDANEVVIKALVDAGMLIARGRLKHQYPHSWRSKKPVIFRNTPQFFIAMDKPIADARGESKPADTLRARALSTIRSTRWVPPQGENRITGMIESRPDWVISRQRAWGVPITVFVRERPDGGVDILNDARVNERIAQAFEREGADAWYADGAQARFLSPDHDPGVWRKIDDILDVWFDSGSTHAFTLEVRDDVKAQRKQDGGADTVMYLEGSDQHRGWFQSSLLESCGTRGRAPFDVVLTHGFVLDQHGHKMSKSLGNVTAPQDVIRQSGADILRMWVCASDYADDLRIGAEILKTTVETYRKLRNTLRWMLGSLAHLQPEDRVAFAEMPEVERLMLHRLAELDRHVRQAYADFDYKRIFAALNAFMTTDLSAFYFDIRKDALYCDPISSSTRRACLSVLDQLFRCTVTWLAPMLPFTAEEAWLARHPAAHDSQRRQPRQRESVHLELFPDLPAQWHNEALADKWRKVRLVRRVVTGAIEVERERKRIGSSLEAAPLVYVSDADLFAAMVDIDLAEVSITSAATLMEGEGPPEAFRLDGVADVAVEVRLARGKKCARSWKILENVGSDPAYPDVSARDARALREWEIMRRAAE